jgi:hypothetical protein
VKITVTLTAYGPDRCLWFPYHSEVSRIAELIERHTPHRVTVEPARDGYVLRVGERHVFAVDMAHVAEQGATPSVSSAIKAADAINSFCNSLRLPTPDVITALTIVICAGVNANGVDREAVLALLQKGLSKEAQDECSRLWRAQVN